MEELGETGENIAFGDITDPSSTTIDADISSAVNATQSSTEVAALLDSSVDAAEVEAKPLVKSIILP